jgi:hypothetical protein
MQKSVVFTNTNETKYQFNAMKIHLVNKDYNQYDVECKKSLNDKTQTFKKNPPLHVQDKGWGKDRLIGKGSLKG